MNSMQFEFDAVVQHLYKQGVAAVSPKHGCSYRTEDGLMCAVGCRIPDELYSPEMEGEVVYTLIDKEFTLPPEIMAYKDMFSELQQDVHDDCYYNGRLFDFDKMSRCLAKVAENYNLTFTEPPRPREQAK